MGSMEALVDLIAERQGLFRNEAEERVEDAITCTVTALNISRQRIEEVIATTEFLDLVRDMIRRETAFPSPTTKPLFPWFELYSPWDIPTLAAKLLVLPIPQRWVKQAPRVSGITQDMVRYIRPWRGSQFLIIDSSSIHYDMESLTDYFTEPQRMVARKAYMTLSPMAWWETEGGNVMTEFREQGHTWPKERIRKARELVFKHGKEVTLFRLTWALSLYRTLLPSGQPAKILDPCSGWGDRLIAARLLGHHYTGYDPSTALRPAYDRILAQWPDADSRVLTLPFEESQEDPGTYDLVFTSPPYFDLEVYSQEETQSLVKYPKYQDWLDRFLYPLVSLASRALKKNGLLALHISDPNKTQALSRDMMVIAARVPSLLYRGVILLQGERGPVWPVWIWQNL